jgi:hypothetical protein
MDRSCDRIALKSADQMAGNTPKEMATAILQSPLRAPASDSFRQGQAGGLLNQHIKSYLQLFPPLESQMLSCVLDLPLCTKLLKIMQNLASSHLLATSLLSVPSVQV